MQDSIKKTTIDYTKASSLHGVQYIFEGGRRLKASRVLWLGLALAAATIGIIWSAEVDCLYVSKSKFQYMIMAIIPQAYADWQDDPTVSTLRTTGMPISNIDFPSITICGQGSIREVIN